MDISELSYSSPSSRTIQRYARVIMASIALMISTARCVIGEGRNASAERCRGYGQDPKGIKADSAALDLELRKEFLVQIAT